MNASHVETGEVSDMEIIFFLFFIVAIFFVFVIISPNSTEKLDWKSEKSEQSNIYLPPKITDKFNLKKNELKFDTELSRLLDSSSASDKFTPPDKQIFDVELLKKIEWRRFEEVCAAYLKEIGFICKMQDFGADGGIDIHLYWGNEENRVALVQCKAWPDSLVGVKPIRELYGVMKSESVKKAFFMTSNDFTKEAKNFAKAKSLTLMTGAELVRRVNLLSEEQVKKLLTIATMGDFTTPTCAKCGKKMIVRLGNPNFWGCTSYPRCRNKLKIKAVSQTKTRPNILY